MIFSARRLRSDPGPFCFARTRKKLLILRDKAQTKEKYDGYFEEDLEYERNGWAGHRDRSDRTGDWSGHLGAGEAVPAVERVKDYNGNRYTN